jgi:hypothetical protein
MSETVLDGIVASLRAALTFDPNVQEPPVALLWPDEGEHWAPVVDRVAQRLPLVTLGAYEPERHRGPAYWIRCVVAGTVDAGLAGGTPIVYLPGVGRGALRATDSCPPELAPIAELQYRSQWFSHPNNRDWSVRALLSHERGLGLRIADDGPTREALQTALARLLDDRIDRLRREVVDAGYLQNLVNPDPVLSIVQWLDDPTGFRARTDAAEWKAFVQRCRHDFEFDPGSSGAVSVARELGLRRPPWDQAWKRFAEAPNRFPGVVAQLRKARPEELVVDPDAWPQDNEEAEDDLRKRLLELSSLTAADARGQVRRLDAENARRRATVWAELDKAPLSFALEQLLRLAEVTSQPLAAGSLDAIVTDYAERGWKADDALVRALEVASDEDGRTAVGAAAVALYRDWLDAGARALQGAIGPLVESDGYRPGSPATVAKGTVVLFVDGLRLDLSHRLRERLEGSGLEVSASVSLSALPTVTRTAKAALLSLPEGALAPGPGLGPANAATGAEATIQTLRALLEKNGVQVLASGETGDPTRPALAEAGEIDRRGHEDGIGLVDSLDHEARRIARRVRDLLDAGWQLVELVTDHGWMLVPGGMEKVALPAATSSLRKGRCARLKEGASVEVPTVPWHWDPGVRIAVAPGATCFEAGKEYEHGGVSPQECVVPRLEVSRGAGAATGVEFTALKWLGLQCRVEYSGSANGAKVDLRTRPGDPASSIAENAKETSGAGRVSLVVPDDENEGRDAYLVLVAADSQVLAQREVVVGRNR